MSVGIFLSITSAIFVASGICMQKIYAKRKREGFVSVSAYKDMTYLNGILYVAIGLVMKAPIFVLVPQTSIAALSAQNFLYTTALDFIVLSTKMTKLTLLSSTIVALGLILTLLEDENSEDVDYSFDDIMKLFFSYRSVALTVSTIAFVICMMELFRISQFEADSNFLLFYISAVTGLFAAWFATVMKAAFEVVSYDYFSSHKGTSYSASWIFLLIAAIILGFYKMKYTASALKQFSSFRFLPLYQSFSILFNAVCGIVYYDEKRYTSKYYTVGLILICGGICSLLLQPHHSPEAKRNYFDSDEGDDREKQSLLGETLPSPATSSGRRTRSEQDEMDFSEYPFINSVAGWLMDLLRYDKSEAHIDYDQFDDKGDEPFSGQNALLGSPNNGKKTSLSSSSPVLSPAPSSPGKGHFLSDLGAFNSIPNASSPLRTDASSSPLFVGSLDVKANKKTIQSSNDDFAVL